MKFNTVQHGDAAELITKVPAESVALSVWSPPYFVGKEYEAHMSFEDWKRLLQEVIRGHFNALKPGGFMVINIGDILCFADIDMPKVQINNRSGKKVKVTKEEILAVKEKHPEYNRYQLAAALGVSEQTIQRRMEGVNIRGGKYAAQTKVLLVGGMLQEFAENAGLYLYDRRFWIKDAAWMNSKWHTHSFKAVDEVENLFIFWKPGETTYDRNRLTKEQWIEWGSRAAWFFPSVRANDDHEAKFPLELPSRFIEMLTDPGDLVLDPFMGSGTTGVAAKKLGRQYLGFELHEKYVKLGESNINKATVANGKTSKKRIEEFISV